MNELHRVRKVLRERQLTLALAESVTCGLASYKMNISSGTSDIFKGGIVAYNEEVKTGLLGIDKKLIDTFSAESQEITDAMAISLAKLIHADVCAAITGLSAPGGTESKEKPVGTVFIAIFYQQKILKCRRRFYGSATIVKRKACNLLFGEIVKALKKV